MHANSLAEKTIQSLSLTHSKTNMSLAQAKCLSQSSMICAMSLTTAPTLWPDPKCITMLCHAAAALYQEGGVIVWNAQELTAASTSTKRYNLAQHLRYGMLECEKMLIGLSLLVHCSSRSPTESATGSLMVCSMVNTMPSTSQIPAAAQSAFGIHASAAGPQHACSLHALPSSRSDVLYLNSNHATCC